MSGLDVTTADLPGWKHSYSGKVRDLYVPDTEALGGPHPLGDVVLVVASDRVSAFDHVLSPGIPGKGKVLTQLSLWWFEQFDDLVGNHVVSTEVSSAAGDGLVPAEVDGRAMICKRLEMFPIECVVRGYLTGSGLAEYNESGEVCGVYLPEGLVDGSKLEGPIFTPAAKAEVGEHDENITYLQMAERIGMAGAEILRDLTINVYARAESIATSRGVILADTKFEFGSDPATGQILLGDEVLTPDSSRFWDMRLWKPGGAQASFDKQYIRDWLASPESGWDKTSGEEPPALPAEVIKATQERYIEAYTRLTGQIIEL